MSTAAGADGLYTLDTLIPDCVGRYITSTTGSVQLGSLINGRTYAKVWQSLVLWLAQQFDAGNSTSVPPLGVIIRAPQLNQFGVKVATFRFFASYLEKCGAAVKKGRAYSDDETGCIRLNIPTLAKTSGLDPATYKIALSHLFRRIGEVLANKESVSIDFSVGTLLSDSNGALEFVFHDYTEDRASRALDPRLLGKSKYQSTKLTPTALAPVASTSITTPISDLTLQLRQRYTLPSSPNAASGTVQKLFPSVVVGATDVDVKTAAAGGKADGFASPRAPQNRQLLGASHLAKVRNIIDLKKTSLIPTSPSPVPPPILATLHDYKYLPTLNAAGTAAAGTAVQASPQRATAAPTAASPSGGLAAAYAAAAAAATAQAASPETAALSSSIAKAVADARANKKQITPKTRVLDVFARTQAATYSTELHYQAVGAKIGSFYTPEAAAFTIDTVTGKFTNTGFMPFVPDRVEKTPEQKKAEQRAAAAAAAAQAAAAIAKQKQDDVLALVATSAGTAADDEQKTSGAIAAVAGPDRSVAAKSHARYEWYVANAIDDVAVAPIKERWIRNSLALLSTNIESVPESRVEQLVRSALADIKADYYDSVKRAILDYVLKSTAEQKRLSVPVPPPTARPDWGCGEAPLAPPRAWREPIQRAYLSLSKHLFLFDPGMAKLLKVWSNYESILLVNVPDTLAVTLASHHPLAVPPAPLTIEEFDVKQRSHLEHVHTTFANDWVNESSAIFRDYDLKRFVDSATMHRYFECVATLMSNQLRSVVERSVTALTDYFVQYRNAPTIRYKPAEAPADGSQPVPVKRSICNIIDERLEREALKAAPLTATGSALVHPAPVFRQTLMVTRDNHGSGPARVTFETSLTEMESHVSALFDDVVFKLTDIQRVKVAASENRPHLRLNVEDKAGDPLLKCRAAVLEVFGRSTHDCARLAELYTEFVYLLDENDRVTRYLRTDHTLEDYKTTIDNYRNVANRILTETHDLVRCGMVVVDCSKVNDELVRTGKELAQRILRHIGEQLKERNFDLQAQFKKFDEDLRRPPKSTEVLVELVRALHTFVESDRPQLERDCADVLHRLHFLFDLEYDVGVDVLAATGKTFFNLRGVDALVRTAEANIAGERVRLLNQRDEQRNALQANLDHLRTQVARCDTWGKTNERLKYMDEIAALKRELDKAETEIDGLNKRESLLGLSVTDFWVLTTTKSALEPYELLWKTVSEWTSNRKLWNSNPARQLPLSADEIGIEVDKMQKTTHRLMQLLRRRHEEDDKKKQAATAAAAAAERAKIEAAGGIVPPHLLAASIATGPMSAAANAAATAAAVAAAVAVAVAAAEKDAKERGLDNQQTNAAILAATQTATATATAASLAAQQAAAKKEEEALEKTPYSVALKMKRELDDFKAHVPLLAILMNPGMKKKHWEQVSEAMQTASEINPVAHNLQRVLGMGVEKHMTDILRINEAATKQYEIERALDRIAREWETVSLSVKPHRATGTHVFTGDSVEDIQSKLDDHIVKTQTMRASPYAKDELFRVIREREEWLTGTQTIIELWLKVQTGWVYLEPVFAFDDISKRLPGEGTMFKVVDTNWRQLMNLALADLKVNAVMMLPSLKEILEAQRKLLVVIQYELNQYLNTKRTEFPRFYFLSNEEILEILSEAKDVARIQPHLKRCFEGIHSLVFRPETNDVEAMQSRDGEIVKLSTSHTRDNRPINPADSKGAVERWLKDVERAMKATVAEKCTQALSAYAHVGRADWAGDWPGQVVVLVNQIHWTGLVAKAITKGKTALTQLLERMNQDFGLIVLKMKQPPLIPGAAPVAAAAGATSAGANPNAGKLSELDRTTLGSLIIQDVHNRDVVQELIRHDVSDPASFEWTSHLRYYWEENLIRVRMLHTTTEYGCEYIGNTHRLVLTSLTDRCFRTLMSAIQLNLGGAPEGPAGTGKSETVKELAKICGMHCFIYNCSDGLDYQAMGRMFKGLCSTGAWSCFDEFNRINVEVLSVIAQQIAHIQHAKDRGMKHFRFEGPTEIPILSSCNVFITMNPSSGGMYSGRSELPDNLKMLFRSIAMMVPDYNLIAEILLYSYGFQDSKALARRLTTTYKLCSEQLATQDHYDYSLRAIRAVLNACRTLRIKAQQTPEVKVKEHQLLQRALMDVNVPKFLPSDVPIFTQIVTDVFNLAPPEHDFPELLKAVELTLERSNLKPVPEFKQKVIQLYDTIGTRHGLMLVGLPYAGKTTCARVLAGALSELAKAGSTAPGVPAERAVKIVTINPKSMTIPQLYGYTERGSSEWQDGVLAAKFREMITPDAAGVAPTRKWLHLDGPVDSLWVENMNTLLDDSRILCLTSGRVLHLTEGMNVIFEVRDLATASPATVSRCGMVYMDPSHLGWKPIAESWLKKLPAGLADSKSQKLIQTLLDWLVPPCLRLVFQQQREHDRTGAATSAAAGAGGSSPSVQQYTPANEINLVVGLLNLFQAQLGDAYNDTTAVDEMGVSRVNTNIECMFLFSLVWSIGAAVDMEGRNKFNSLLKEVCKEVREWKLSRPFLKTKTVYEVKYRPDSQEWMPWLDPSRSLEIPHQVRYHEIIVPTTDTVRYTYLFDLLAVSARRPVLFVGPTGTGKTVHINQRLATLNRDVFAPHIAIQYSTNSTAAQTQSLVDAKLTCRRRLAGLYGPASGKRCIVFVDDVNMPRRDKFGSQPPLELLRSFIDQGGWYDQKDKTFRTVQDVTLVAAMGPATTGRPALSDRFLRHWSTISVTPLEDATLSSIFTAILKWHFDGKTFAPDVAALVDEVVGATRDVYTAVITNCLPSPGKSHYTFSLRDFSRVIAGVCTSKPEYFEDAFSLIRLWVHEVHRVFADRLVDDKEQLQFLNWTRDATKARFNVDFDKVCAHLDEKIGGVPAQLATGTPAVEGKGDGRVNTLGEIRNLYFGDYFDRKQQQSGASLSASNNPNSAMATGARPYQEITEHRKLAAVWQMYLDDYNYLSQKPMKLVMFRFAIEHASRIARILKHAMGHALLIGVGGSGKQSLTRLAASVMGYEFRQPELSAGPVGGSSRAAAAATNPDGSAAGSGSGVGTVSVAQKEWRDQLKSILKTAGGKEGRPTVFCITDSQFGATSSGVILDDINSLLTSGEIATLWDPIEVAGLIEDLKPHYKRMLTANQNKQNASGAGASAAAAAAAVAAVADSKADAKDSKDSKDPKVIAAAAAAAAAAAPGGNAVDGGDRQLMAFFAERVRANLHLVLCMSPVGKQFRARLRTYPSLVHCCAVDWFSPWPQEALFSVATDAMRAVLPSPDVDSKTRDGSVEMCMYFHRTVTETSAEFERTLGRHNYVTPTSYLEQMAVFRELLGEQRRELSLSRGRYQKGLAKLADTEQMVKAMQEQLKRDQPELKALAEETEKMMTHVTKEAVEETKIREGVKQEEGKRSQLVALQDIAEKECAANLAKAQPLLDAALDAIDTLDTQAMADIKAMRPQPTKNIRLVLTALCIMLGVPPARVADPNTAIMKDDYFEPAKKHILSNPRLFAQLRQFSAKANQIKPDILRKIRKFIAMPEFDLAKLKVQSRAAHTLASWIYAIENYDRQYKIVKPKQDALEASRKNSEVVKAALDVARGDLLKVETRMKSLYADLKTMKDKKEELERRTVQCEKRKGRAEKLLSRLGGANESWVVRSAELAAKYTTVTGDCLLASGIIAYLGAFTAPFRNACIAKWVTQCKASGVACSDGFGLLKTLGDPVTIRRWQLDGLPADSFSIENAIIMQKTIGLQRRWPLCIDPQRQANAWIKKFERRENVEHQIVVLRLTEDAPSSGSGGPSGVGSVASRLQNAISSGLPTLLEDVGERIDQAWDPILNKQSYKNKNQLKMIKFGEREFEYNDKFRLYITTKLRNPHFLPELATKVTVLNFAITSEGLAEQLLSLVVAAEKHELEEHREKLIFTSAVNQSKLRDIEDKILKVLSTSQGSILDEDDAITVLTTSKTISNEIEEKQRIADRAEKENANSRALYKPVAVHATILYSVIADLADIDPMYQFSLTWFNEKFNQSIALTELSHHLFTRITALNERFTHLLYTHVCRSLFDKDKLLFSFLLASRLVMGANAAAIAAATVVPVPAALPAGAPAAAPGATAVVPPTPAATAAAAPQPKLPLDPIAWRFFLTGGHYITLPPAVPLNPADSVFGLSTHSWTELCRLSYCGLPAFAGLDTDFATYVDAWADVYRSNEPWRAVFPGRWASLTTFERMCVVRCLRPDKVMAACRAFVVEVFGGNTKYIETEPFDIDKAYADSNATTPLVFILSPGADPLAALSKLAFSKQMHDKVHTVSLGRDQGGIAVELIRQAARDGQWVVLQNCHLAESFMPELERVVESFQQSSSSIGASAAAGDSKGTDKDSKTGAAPAASVASVTAAAIPLDGRPAAPHPDYRLWLTSYPYDKFPVSILQCAVKMTTEAPSTVRDNLFALYHREPLGADSKFFDECKTKPNELRALTYGLCVFHALITERRNYGALGWNVPYEFNESDWRISLRQLHGFLSENTPTIPFRALRYLIGELNYGGRITDDWDRRTLLTLLEERFLRPEATLPGWSLLAGAPAGVNAAAPSASPLITVVPVPTTPMGGAGAAAAASATTVAPAAAPTAVAVATNLYPIPPTDPAHSSHSAVLDTIRALPLVSPPALFGFSDNAELTKELRRSAYLLASVNKTEAQASGWNATATPVAAAVAATAASPVAAGAGGADSKDPAPVAGAAAGTALVVATSARAVKEQRVIEVMNGMSAALPPRFDMVFVYGKFPHTLNDSIGSVIVQECNAYNKLTDAIRKTINNLRLALSGHLVMSAELERTSDALYADIVPAGWMTLSYPSLRPLHAWFNDLCSVRLRFLSDWVDNNHRPPPVVNLAAFFYPNSFLTAVLQNWVRKQKGAVPFSDVVFDVDFVDSKSQSTPVPPTPGTAVPLTPVAGAAGIASGDVKGSGDGDLSSRSTAAPSAVQTGDERLPKPTDGGVYVRGLWLEGGAWDYGRKQLTDLRGHTTTAPAPIMLLKPAIERDLPKGGVNHYRCPVYRTSARCGSLTTSGHSSNFIFSVRLPTAEPKEKWILRGVAIVTEPVM